MFQHPKEWKRRSEAVAERAVALRKALDDVRYFDGQSNPASSLESKLDDLSELREYLLFLEEDHRREAMYARTEKGRPFELKERMIVSQCKLLFELYSDLKPSTTVGGPFVGFVGIFLEYVTGERRSVDYLVKQFMAEDREATERLPDELKELRREALKRGRQ